MQKFFVVTSAVLCFSAAALAQPVSYGRQMPKDPAAKEVGILSYDLSRDGDIIGIELFGADDRSLAKCEMTASIRAQEVICDVPDRGRFRAKLWYRGGEFEDLNTGEYFRTRFEVESELPEGLIELEPGEELPTLHGQYITESDLSEEEIMQRWGDVFPLLGLAGGEAQVSLGLPGVQPLPESEAPGTFSTVPLAVGFTAAWIAKVSTPLPSQNDLLLHLRKNQFPLASIGSSKHSRVEDAHPIQPPARPSLAPTIRTILTHLALCPKHALHRHILKRSDLLGRSRLHGPLARVSK